MIAQTTIDTAVTDLKAVITAALPLLQGVATSTPDASVQGLVDAVNAATSTLTTAITPAAPAPAPEPPAPAA